MRYRPLDDLLVEEADEGWYPDLFTLSDGGGTSAGLRGSERFSWSVAGAQLVLESGSDRYEYTPFETDGYVFFALVSYYVDGASDPRGRSSPSAAAGDLPC